MRIWLCTLFEVVGGALTSCPLRLGSEGVPTLPGLCRGILLRKANGDSVGASCWNSCSFLSELARASGEMPGTPRTDLRERAQCSKQCETKTGCPCWSDAGAAVGSASGTGAGGGGGRRRCRHWFVTGSSSLSPPLIATPRLMPPLLLLAAADTVVVMVLILVAMESHLVVLVLATPETQTSWFVSTPSEPGEDYIRSIWKQAESSTRGGEKPGFLMQQTAYWTRGHGIARLAPENPGRRVLGPQSGRRGTHEFRIFLFFNGVLQEPSSPLNSFLYMRRMRRGEDDGGCGGVWWGEGGRFCICDGGDDAMRKKMCGTLASTCNKNLETTSPSST